MKFFLVLLTLGHGGFNVTLQPGTFATRDACLHAVARTAEPALCLSEPQLQKALAQLQSSGVIR